MGLGLRTERKNLHPDDRLPGLDKLAFRMMDSTCACLPGLDKQLRDSSPFAALLQPDAAGPRLWRHPDWIFELKWDGSREKGNEFSSCRTLTESLVAELNSGCRLEMFEWYLQGDLGSIHRRWSHVKSTVEHAKRIFGLVVIAASAGMDPPNGALIGQKCNGRMASVETASLTFGG